MATAQMTASMSKVREIPNTNAPNGGSCSLSYLTSWCVSLDLLMIANLLEQRSVESATSRHANTSCAVSRGLESHSKR